MHFFPSRDVSQRGTAVNLAKRWCFAGFIPLILFSGCLLDIDGLKHIDVVSHLFPICRVDDFAPLGCRTCAYDKDCAQEVPYCTYVDILGGSHRACAQCLSDEDCLGTTNGYGPSPLCSNGSCGEDCWNDEQCGEFFPSRPFCQDLYNSGRCVECREDADCSEPNAVCVDAGYRGTCE